jgi:enamine deaminase RidA (YjgF/YER057c/UK114 family)
MRTTRLNPAGVAPPVGNYSHSVRVETREAIWIYVSGQIAQDPDGRLVAPGDLPAQTEQVFENVSKVLESNGATFTDVVKILTFFTTFDGLEASRQIRARYLSEEPPASTTVRVAALVVPDAVIEVDVVAVISA